MKTSSGFVKVGDVVRVSLLKKKNQNFTVNLLVGICALVRRRFSKCVVALVVKNKGSSLHKLELSAPYVLSVEIIR